MTTYRVQRMPRDNYHTMMMGGYAYNVENLKIEAETTEEAKKMAEKDGYIVNDFVETVEEYEAEIEAQKIARAEAEAKREAANKKRLATEIAKAEAVGMTLEEYRAEKSRKGQIKRLKNEIEDLEKTLKRKRAYLKKLEG